MEELASKEKRSKLHYSTLKALSVIGDYPLHGSSEIEFIDEENEFSSFTGLLDKFVGVDKLATSSKEVPQTEEKNIEITTTNESDDNATDMIDNYVSMPVLTRNVQVNGLKRQASFLWSREPTHNKQPFVFTDFMAKIKKEISYSHALISPKTPRAPGEKKIQIDNESRLSSYKKPRLDSHLSESQNNASPDNVKWKKIAEGSYNDVYLVDSPESNRKVRKIRKNEASKMDDPDRATRVYTEINKALSSNEQAVKIDKNTWESRYIEGDTPSTKEITECLFKIYIETDRIVIDGYCKNFIKEHSTNKIYCIDPGLAVRRNSVASYNHWYAPNERAVAIKETHYKHMYEWIENYTKQDKETEHQKSLVIFCIIGLDYHDRYLRSEIDKKPLSPNSIVVLGILVYCSHKIRYTLAATCCTKVLEKKWPEPDDIAGLIPYCPEKSFKKINEMLEVTDDSKIDACVSNSSTENHSVFFRLRQEGNKQPIEDLKHSSPGLGL